MFKKLVLLLVITLIGGVIFLPEITSAAATHALKKENTGKSWAPDMALTAAKINLRMYRYKTAASIYERSLKTWPKADWRGDAAFQYALCFEKQDQGTKAIEFYKYYLTTFPGHPWNDQATKRIANIQANQM